mgnify:CR=1 FL=1
MYPASLEPLLLLFQTPHGGNKPLVGIMLLLAPVRCDVIRTVIFDGVVLFGLIYRVVWMFVVLYRMLGRACVVHRWIWLRCPFGASPRVNRVLSCEWRCLPLYVGREVVYPARWLF